MQTAPTSQRGRVPSFTADNDEDDDDDDGASFWDECDKAAKKNPAPQRARTQQKKTVDKEEVCVYVHMYMQWLHWSIITLWELESYLK